MPLPKSEYHGAERARKQNADKAGRPVLPLYHEGLGSRKVLSNHQARSITGFQYDPYENY